MNAMHHPPYAQLRASAKNGESILHAIGAGEVSRFVCSGIAERISTLYSTQPDDFEKDTIPRERLREVPGIIEASGVRLEVTEGAVREALRTGVGLTLWL